MKVATWEYKLLEVPYRVVPIDPYYVSSIQASDPRVARIRDTEALSTRLTALGSDGWEVIAVDCEVVYLRRPINS